MTLFTPITTVAWPAVNYDLTDLATAKTELNATNGYTDAWISQAITQVSKAIGSYLKRVIVPEYVQDAFDYDRGMGARLSQPGDHELQLTRWPIIAVVSVVQTSATGTSVTLVEGTDFRTDLANGTLLRLDGGGHGTRWEGLPVTVNYLAGYGAKATETQTVGTSPYKVTVTQSAAFSCDVSVAYANGTKLARVASSPTTGQYSVGAGVYTFAAGDTGQALTFTYGAKAVPGDLAEAALRLVTARYKARDRDPALVQQDTPGVGTQRYWIGAHPGQASPFAPDIEYLIAPYLAPAFA